MNNLDMLLTNINRNNIHPPPEIEEVLNFFNSKKPMRDRNRCHAFMILRYSVAKECKRIREFNVILIGQATNHLWKNSTSNEKLEYFNLAQRPRITYGKNSTTQEKAEYFNLEHSFATEYLSIL
ncbi:hypothetical protein Glove_310g25 [Diversispora epigaea]|uniref:HMG box domain-containing protein n=1 Tax=Diversispora epigaea TaxID=1348612 RepID=A0A397HVA3_9GLOM|nr:hypothetical protein Glove_310g25 [Diversispora epigaea]